MLKSERAFAARAAFAAAVVVVAAGWVALPGCASWPCGSAATYALDPYCAMSRVVTVPSRSAALPPHQHQPTK
jgi:hypothetical protein